MAWTSRAAAGNGQVLGVSEHVCRSRIREREAAMPLTLSSWKGGRLSVWAQVRAEHTQEKLSGPT